MVEGTWAEIESNFMSGKLPKRFKYLTLISYFGFIAVSVVLVLQFPLSTPQLKALSPLERWGLASVVGTAILAFLLFVQTLGFKQIHIKWPGPLIIIGLVIVIIVFATQMFTQLILTQDPLWHLIFAITSALLLLITDLAGRKYVVRGSRKYFSDTILYVDIPTIVGFGGVALQFSLSPVEPNVRAFVSGALAFQLIALNLAETAIFVRG